MKTKVGRKGSAKGCCAIYSLHLEIYSMGRGFSDPRLYYIQRGFEKEAMRNEN